MEISERTTLVVDMLAKDNYLELAEILYRSRNRIQSKGEFGDECVDICVSILSHVMRYLHCVANFNEGQGAMTPNKDSEKPFFEIWYSLGAFGIEEEDLCSDG